MHSKWLNPRIIATLPLFISVNVVALVIWSFAISPISMPLILGVIAGGLVDLDNRLSGRLKNLFYTLIAFSLSSLIVQLTIVSQSLFVLAMMLMTFLLTMLGAFGQRYSTIAFGSLVVSVYVMLTYDSHNAWYLNPIMILSGAIIYSLTAMLVYLIFPNRPVQANMAAAFATLANYLDQKSTFFDPDDGENILAEKEIKLAVKNSLLINAINNCRHSLLYRLNQQSLPTRTAYLLKYFSVIQDIYEQANANYFDYTTLVPQLQFSDLIFRIQRLLELQAQACRDISLSLQQNSTYRYNPRLFQAIQGLDKSFEVFQQQTQYQQSSAQIKVLLNNLKAIDRQLQFLDCNNIKNWHNTKENLILNEEKRTFYNIWTAFKSQFSLDSQLFRHAIRLSIVVAICCIIARSFELERGYWILLTAVFVCQPNYTATKTRLKQRIIGTLLGVLVGSLLPHFTTHLESQLGIVVASSTLYFFFRTNNYSFSTFFITIQVLMSFHIIGMNISAALLPRIVDTLLGCAISWLAVSYLWPDWKYLRLTYTLDKSVKNNAYYLLSVVAQLQFGHHNSLKYRLAQRRAYDSAIALNETVSNMNYRENKDKARLNNGFELLKLNYALVSYITTLSTYQKQLDSRSQDTLFLVEFYPVARKVVNILEKVAQINNLEFQQNLTELQAKLHQLKQLDEKFSQQFRLPVQQLNMIVQILPDFYYAYQKELNKQQE